MANHTVLISGNRITATGPDRDVRIPRGAQVVDGQGKYLIPGLWDMHVHIRGSRLYGQPGFAKENEAVLPLYLANGITGIREMGGDLVDVVLEWRDQIAQGKRDGPRILTCGPKLDGPKPVWPGSVPINNADEARASVALVKKSGADFVKVYNSTPNIPRDAFMAILAESNRLGLRVTGHLTADVLFSEAAAAGQHFEHLPYILRACSATVKETSLPTGAPSKEAMSTITKAFDPEVAKALLNGFVRSGTWVTPTLNVFYQLQFATEDPAVDPRNRYMPARLLASWTDRARGQTQAVPPQAPFEDRKAYFARSQELIRLMKESGVPLLAGSDTGTSNPRTYPGFSLHQELERLTEAGLTPMEALRIATWNAAKWAGKLDVLGSIEKGKLADLVLLDANPLADIRNTTRIHTVIANGKLFDRTRLDLILREVEKSRRVSDAPN